ncbi:MAG: hypothetical protein AAF762_15170 [Pseudomonadota bacterium]
MAARVAVVVFFAYAIHVGLEWVQMRAEQIGNESLMIGALVVLLLCYALLIAVPFMPGVEIGISLLLLKGAAIAPFVYAATVTGLALAFVAGRLVPYSWLHALLRDLRLKAACQLVEKLEPMDRTARMAHLVSRLPERARPWVKAGRYVLLAGLLNLPGNSVIGGGGGIAFLAGFSRLFRPWLTAIVFLLAVAPVPFVVWLTGTAALR